MKILVVDDEARFAQLVGEELKDAGHEVTVLSSGVEAVQAVKAGFDVVVTDLRMKPVDGIGVLEAAKAASPSTEVVLITGDKDVGPAIDAFHKGAYDYLIKGGDLRELHVLIERIGREQALEHENRALRRELADTGRMAEMVGTSAALARVRELCAKVASSDATVLVLGESGVGKELVARLIHRTGRRAGQPFVVMHAAALPENLLESELFGFEKGAFTGATSRKPGRVEAADSGTLFLDEIGEISAALQVKLLRFLQERTFVRVGGNETIRVDARIIAATNRNLEGEVKAGRFREDLYYRLAVFPITVPPLRERRNDIAALSRHIFARLGYTRDPSAEVARELADYDWPGNVRELENVLERALILAGTEAIGPQHIQLPEPVLARPGQTGALAGMEREMLEEALRRAGGNKSKAAKSLGITRRMLYTKLQRYGLASGEDVDT